MITQHTPAVVQYLRQHGLEKLCEDFSIKAKRHNEFPNLVGLKYSQIDSPRAHPIVCECRGIILDERNEWDVVSMPFVRFFNHNEVAAARIDWTTAQTFTKLDGSLMSLYPYEGEWHVASSGVPDAHGAVGNNNDLTMKSLFWRAWDEAGYVLPPDACLYGADRCCFMFELMTPHNRVVVPHATNKLVLIGARNLYNLEELRPSVVAATMGWECVSTTSATDIGSLFNDACELNPMEQEGYVVCDAKFNRVKVKSPAYVALHHLKGSFGVKSMVELVRTNEGAEFLSYFPELKPDYSKVKRRYDDLVSETVVAYAVNRHIVEQKEFALAIKDARCTGTLFALRNGKTASVEASLRVMPLDTLVKLLGLKDVEYA